MQTTLRTKAAVLPAVMLAGRFQGVPESPDAMRERFEKLWGDNAVEDARAKYPNDIILALAWIRFSWFEALLTSEGDAMVRSYAEAELLERAKPEERLAWDMLVSEGHTSVAEIKAARDEWAEMIEDGIAEGRREGLHS